MYRTPMAVCPTCRQPGLPGAAFCMACGNRLVPDAAEAPVDRFLGQTFNDTYFIQQKIGSGGMGEVYKAIHCTLESPVALKIIRPGLLSDPAMVRRFQREARAASRLHHPNIVAVTDFAQTEDGFLYMVMELVSGRTLARVIAEEAPFPERRVVRIGAQILAALAEAHANQILHRDLKAENVMIESRRDAVDAVRVLDFGIAKIMAAGSSTLTREGLVCGTPGYMSPEQIRGEEIDGRADIFSAGIVLYEMLTHKLPFDAQTPLEILHRHLTEPVPPPSVRRGAPISPALEQLVLRALSSSREARPASAEVMRDELLKMAPSLDPPGAAEPEPAHPTEVLRQDVPLADPGGSDTPGAQRPGGPPVRPVAAGSGPARAPGGATPDATATLRPQGGDAQSGARLDAAVVKRIEQRIAPLLGPVTPQLVRRVSHGASTPTDLCRQLAAFIPSKDEKKKFLAWSDKNAEPRPDAGAAPGRPGTIQPSSTPPTAWDPTILERVRRELAQYLGPVSGAIVRRVSPKAGDLTELYRRLSLEIPREQDRERFLRAASQNPDGR